MTETWVKLYACEPAFPSLECRYVARIQAIVLSGRSKRNYLALILASLCITVNSVGPATMTHTSDPLTASPDLGHCFIGGEWQVPIGGESVPVINPATEAPFAKLALGNAEDVERAVKAARDAFPSWCALPAAERQKYLVRILALLEDRREEFAQAISREMGAAISYARIAHLPYAIAHVRVAAENLSTYEFCEMRGSTAIVREPIGVCGLITPWNWPLYQITAKVAPALAVGCTLVLKPSELSPLSASLFAQLLDDAKLPPGVFNLVHGSGEGVGEPLCRHADVDMISLTGSTRAGVLVSQAAAHTIKRVALELGGKSPNIILPDADLQKAVAPGVGACFRNVGQSCSAPTRMLVPREHLAEVEAIALQAQQDIRVGDPADEETTHGPIANRAQYERVQTMIEQGIAEGARLVSGGSGKPEGLSQGFYVRPTIFSDVGPDMAIAREEIFGPVLVIMPYDSVDEAIAIANATEYGLSAHVQGSDLDEVRRVAKQIRSGQVHFNYPQWDPQVPFGGYKQSGNGREFGIEGMEEFLEIKAMLGYDPAAN